VLADALSGLRGLPGLDTVKAYDLILTAEPSNAAAMESPQVLRLGPMPASRRLQRWLAAQGGPQVLVSEGDARPLDPLRLVRAQCGAGLAAWLAGRPQHGRAGEATEESLALAERWRRAEAAVQALLEQELADEEGEPALARRLSRLLPAGLPVLLANSSPVRDWESFADPAAPPRPMHGFRGASGIDGTLSSACYIDDAFPAALALAWRHAGDFPAGIVANARCGGDNCHRAAVVGSLLAISAPIPATLVEGLRTQPLGRTADEGIPAERIGDRAAAR
jgi:2-succinyl-5-enolpyruvyl-6-hydroxy-3-cyclohexene-1-carboxylate synthase